MEYFSTKMKHLKQIKKHCSLKCIQILFLRKSVPKVFVITANNVENLNSERAVTKENCICENIC